MRQARSSLVESLAGRTNTQGLWVWVWLIPLVMISGVLALAAYAGALHSWSVFGYGIAVGGAAILAGGLVGFIFAIPRSASGNQPQVTGEQYQDNSNLDQISDWLTKILVGVGLVQLGRATSGVSHLASAMEPGFGGKPSSASFGLAIAFFYAGTGFLYLYLWTRTGFLLQLRSLENLKKVAREAAETKAAEVAQVASQEKLAEVLAELENLRSKLDTDAAEIKRTEVAETTSQENLEGIQARSKEFEHKASNP